MQAKIRNMLALAMAMLFATTTAGAETIGSGVVTLRPDPATGAVHLTEVGEGESLGRVLEIERGKSLLVETAYRVKRVSVGDPDLLDVAVHDTPAARRASDHLPVVAQVQAASREKA